MNILPRALRTRSHPLILATALAVATVGLPAVATHAEMPQGGQGETATCYWDGKAYSPGGVVTESDGTKHTCQKDGTWNFALMATGLQFRGAVSDLPEPSPTPNPLPPIVVSGPLPVAQ